MVDFAMDVFRQLYHDKEVPKELRDKRVTVVSELKSLQSAVVPITTILEDPHVTEQIQNSRDGRQLFETLQKDHKFKPEYLDVLYNFAKFQYECGNYSGAAEYLYFHRVLAEWRIPCKPFNSEPGSSIGHFSSSSIIPRA